jgi:hypothetical protein
LATSNIRGLKSFRTQASGVILDLSPLPQGG